MVCLPSTLTRFTIFFVIFQEPVVTCNDFYLARWFPDWWTMACHLPKKLLTWWGSFKLEKHCAQRSPRCLLVGGTLSTSIIHLRGHGYTNDPSNWGAANGPFLSTLTWCSFPLESYSGDSLLFGALVPDSQSGFRGRGVEGACYCSSFLSQSLDVGRQVGLPDAVSLPLSPFGLISYRLLEDEQHRPRPSKPGILCQSLGTCFPFSQQLVYK